MEYKELGKSGERVSSIGMGTWKLGMNPEIEIRALRKGLNLGINVTSSHP
jgi:aryl-alcohol dehydrogenase-like predicted oxidoreductase